MRFAVCLLFAAAVSTVEAEQTNLPSPPMMPAPFKVPAPQEPLINKPPPPLVPTPASPYLSPVTGPVKQKSLMPPPTMLRNGADVMREGWRRMTPPPTAVSIAATQKVEQVVVKPPAPEPKKTVEPLWVGLVKSNRVWYVDASGTDMNFGTRDAPWHSIQKAADVAQPGDTVLVMPGAYEGFETKRSGKPGRPIIFRAKRGAVVNASHHNPPDHILVRKTDWIVIEGFTVQDAPRAGISVLESSDVVVSNNVCGPNGVWGIFSGFAPHIQVIGNKAFKSRKEHGIYISNSRVADDNPIVRGNECFDNGTSGIQLNGDYNMGGDGLIDGALIEDNFLHDNDSKGFSLASIAGSIIRNNITCNNGRVAGAAGIHLSDEPGCGKPSHNNLVVNNTIIERRITAIRLSNGAYKNTIFNNLIVGPRGIVDEGGDNNIDTDSNLHIRDPLDVFVNPFNGDFHLRRGCRADHGGRWVFHEKRAPTNDISGIVRSFDALPSIGAYDMAPQVPVYEPASKP